ncbi:glucosamine inositolphosphorylceramide transferase family protein [Neobacillus muris]|uniref:glucosamine inositolphosphorylceramide transferase family protein n=1 Tax=Neobacillus muris TaxID=2941334 RepID=UPI00203ED831|nr:hypothetical protein [Neobacillus muris]
MINKTPDQKILKKPSLQAADVTDVPAEFIADPFILSHKSLFYMFFEILDKTTGKGIVGVARSKDGENWKYDRAILKEKFHLSYPYVFKFKNHFFMIPESSEANQVILYRAKSFPYEWEKVSVLVEGNYVDSSIFYFNDKWWLYAGKSGKLHLFYSDTLDSNWKEHPQSPLIMNNYNITRPGGRVIVDTDKIYRYTQETKPNYGSAVRVFNITKLTEFEYEEEPMGLVLNGSNKNKEWNKDGMHTIDQLKLEDHDWIVAVDGHKLIKKSYLVWKLDRIWSKYLFERRHKYFTS